MDLKLSVVFFFSIILYIQAKQDFTNSNVNIKRKAINEWSDWKGSAIGSGVFQDPPFTYSDKPLNKSTKPLENTIPVEKPLLETKTRPVLGYNRKKPVLVIKKKPFLVIKKKPFLVIKKKPVLVIKKNPVVLIKKNPLLVVVNEKKLSNPCSGRGKIENTCNVNAQHITGGTFVGKRETKEKRQWYGNTANVNAQVISNGNFVGKRDAKENSKRQWYGNTANVNAQVISNGNFYGKRD